MLSRQDNENIYLVLSDNVHFWYESKALLKPMFPWELVQLGNCGSPIETEAGWLVLSHGVGPLRTYCIGAFLLDRDNPGKVIGRLREPLLRPDQKERKGYVPNVVYTCGALLHNGELIIPYGMLAKSIAASGTTSWICFAASIPFRRGRCRSRRIKSGLSSRAFWTASIPFAVSLTDCNSA